MPTKKNKAKKQRRDNNPKEEMPKDQAAKAEGNSEQRMEEKAPESAEKPSASVKSKDAAAKAEGNSEQRMEEKAPEPAEKPSASVKSKDAAAKAEGNSEQRMEEKAPEPAEKPSASGKSKDALWEEYMMLKQELEQVRRQKNSFRLEADKAQRSWNNSRRNLEETKYRMREKLRLRQEAQKRHIEETEEHRQKLRQMETEHHNEICELKMAIVARKSSIQEEHEEREAELREKLHNLKAEKREKERCTVEQLKLKHHDELRQLKNSYEEQQREIEAQYTNKMKVMVEENNSKTQKELAEIDKRMKKRAKSVRKECDNALDLLKVDMMMIKSNENQLLFEESRLEKMEKLDRKLDGDIEAATEKNKHLKEAVSNMEATLLEKEEEEKVQRKDMAKRLKKSRKLKERVEKEKREVYLKECQLETKYEQLLQELDQMKKTKTEMILKLQQESSFKELLTERKIAAVSKTLEREQLKLWVALAFTQGDQTAAKNIKELFESQQATIKALREEVSRDLKEYNELAGKATGSDTFAHEDTSEDNELTSLMEELTALCISKDDSGQKDEQGQNPASAESRP